MDGDGRQANRSPGGRNEMKTPDLSKDETYALLGVKRDGKGFGCLVAETLETRGYTFFVIHPEAHQVGGWTTVPHVHDLPSTPDAAILCTPRERARPILESLHREGIKRVYAAPGAVDDCGRIYAHEHGMELYAECPLLHVGGLGFPHNIHRRIARLFGG
jgi:predicted CoA-binding protein